MSKPKTIYTTSEASRLRRQPCIHCGTMSRVDRRPQPDLGGNFEGSVSVFWYCPNKLCAGSDGFSTEQQ